MKLIQKIGSRKESQNSTRTKQWGLFECPVCTEHVEKPLSHGRKNKSCGKKECKKAVFVNKKSDTSECRKEPVISTLPHYSSMYNFYKRLSSNSEFELDSTINAIRKFCLELYADYATVREMNPNASIYVTTKDNSRVINKYNCQFKASEEIMFDKDLLVDELQFSCYALMYQLGITHANAVRTLKQVCKGYTHKNVVARCGKKFKVLVVDEEDYNKTKIIVGHNKNLKKVSSNIYLIKSGAYTKIGITENVNKRLRSLNNSNPTGVELIASWDYAEQSYEVEQYLHKKYKKYNKSLEWFCLTQEQIDEISNQLTNKKILKEIAEFKNKEYNDKIQSIKLKNQKLVDERISAYEESKRQSREANKKPVIETVHEWDERFEHDRTNQIEATTTHGMSKTSLYKAWQTMKKVYGVCEEWQKFEPFKEAVEEEYNKYTEDQIARIYPLNKGLIGPNNYTIKPKADHVVKSTVAKAVEQLDKDGCVIAEYRTVTEAAKAVDGIASKISAVCRGTRKTHADYKWRYKE
jgi:hypothetical protein